MQSVQTILQRGIFLSGLRTLLQRGRAKMLTHKRPTAFI